jgi:predicted regulator of Ras-like GTPase activity (Roadblock/LC7/MglB family)
MSSRLGELLETTMKSPGVVAAVRVDSQGRIIEYASNVEGDFARTGSIASEMLRQWRSVGVDLGMGTVRSLMIERPDGPATITPLGPDAALLVIGTRSCRFGRLWLDAKRAWAALGEVKQTESEPEVGVSPRPAEHRDGLVRTLETTSATTTPAPHNLTMGEVVLKGAHTFRLVTKLVTQLLKMRGVRSSSLRAYSPISTVIDVVLEDGATMAAIDRQCFEEFSIERTEEGGTRLVLRADEPFAVSPDPIGTPG